MKMKPDQAQSARQLWKQLISIFPNFSENCSEQGIEEQDHEFGLTSHFIMGQFTYFFGKNREGFSKKQLQAFGIFIDQTLLMHSEMENAISTCFLEHLRQIKSYKFLSPYLSARTKRRTSS